MESISSRQILNHTLLTDFYELTMANGYYELSDTDVEALNQLLQIKD